MYCTCKNSCHILTKMHKVFNYGLQSQSKFFAPHSQIGQTRRFWEYVNMMFNKPDLERRKSFGPDRTCAEWVLRNGGKVVWVGGKVVSDYNLLPRETLSVPKISEIDATNSSISHYGFPHLIGCTMLQKIILHKARYIDDMAMKGLSHGKSTLTHVQVSRCVNVTDAGIKALKDLEKLETLVIFSLPSVDNLGACLQFLLSHLPTLKVIGAASNEESQKN